MPAAFALLVSLCTTNLCTAADFNPFDGPKPILVFIQTDPWAMVIGSDSPRVAVYENGDVVFSRKVDERRRLHAVSLDKAGLEKIREKLKPVLALQDVKAEYDLKPNVTDLPEAMFYVRDGTREIATTVYGLMSADTELPAYTEFPAGPKPTRPPSELLALHKWLCEIDFPNSKEWSPRYVEVMLWDYSYAPEASIRWPAEWPSLKSERAFPRGDSYSIFLDGSLLPKLREFLATRKEKGAVEIEKKKMSAAYRLTFPSEPIWRKAFQAAAERDEQKEQREDKPAGK